MTLPIIDFVFIVIIAACALGASLKGFVNEVFDKGAPVLGIWAAVLFYRMLAQPLLQYVKIAAVANVLGFVIVFILVFLVIKIIQQLIGNIFADKIFRQLDHSLGFLFGLVEGVAFVTVILIILMAQPWFNVDGLIGGSIFYRMLKSVASLPAQTISSAVVDVSSGRQ
jgi:membrane protein required for colicin V production